MKICIHCRVAQPLAEFYRHPRMADGHLNACKKCCRRRARAFRADRVEHWRDYDRGRASERTFFGDWRRKSRKQRERNPIAAKARTALSNAIRDGRIHRPSCCSQCSRAGSIQGHHDDYAKPLHVRWLCRRCHIETHSAKA